MKTELGPMAFPRHRDRVLSYGDIAKSDGAEILHGGREAPGFERGLYIEPTAVLVTNNKSRVCQEEIFGPFVTIQKVADVDEAETVASSLTATPRGRLRVNMSVAFGRLHIAPFIP